MSKLTLFSRATASCIALAASVLWLSPAQLAAQDERTVVAVNYALSYFAERILDTDAEVIFPVPEDADPSFWNPSIAAISTMQRADLILLNGAGFATWTTKASLPRSKIVNTSRGFEEQYIKTETVTHSHGADGEHSHTGTATYMWLDPELAVLQAQAIAAAAEQRDLAEPADINDRLGALTEDLEALDASATELTSVGAGQHLIATHPRYQYLARAYDLEISSLEWDAGASPDPAQLSELEQLMEDTGAKVLIWEAEPSGEAREAVRAMGLSDVVFPTLATTPQGSDYLKSYATAVDDLTNALKNVSE